MSSLRDLSGRWHVLTGHTCGPECDGCGALADAKLLTTAGDDIRNGEARALEERAAAEAKLAAEAPK